MLAYAVECFEQVLIEYRIKIMSNINIKYLRKAIQIEMQQTSLFLLKFRCRKCYFLTKNYFVTLFTVNHIF